MYKGICIFSLWIAGQSSFAVINPKVSLKENGSDILVTKDQNIKTIYPPFNNGTVGRLRIVIPGVPKDKKSDSLSVENAKVIPTLAMQVKASRLLQEANTAFFDGDTAKSWQLIDQAEVLYPDYYLIKSMKGSLMYKAEAIDLAIALWEQSLLQNPDQPEIASLLSRVKKKDKSL